MAHLLPVHQEVTPDAPDETPMARVESETYFAYTPPVVTAIMRAVDQTAVSTSVAHFLSWRPPSLDSSNSSLESKVDSEAPMPTVARVHGGAEWDAELSRRSAKRRTRGRCSGVVPRKAPPLFPTRSSCTPNVGLDVRQLLHDTFSRVSTWSRGWKGVVIAALVVGVGLYCTRRV